MSNLASYHEGFAPRDGAPLYPSLWRGCVGAWNPGLGPTGLTLRDWSGRGNHGTLTNMDPGTDWVTSQGRYALDFDGSNDYVVTGNIGVTSAALRLAAWMNTTSSGARRGLVSFGAPGDAAYIDMLTTGYIRVAVENSGAYMFRDSSLAINDGGWHRVELLFTAGTVTVVVDGRDVTTGGGSSGSLTAVNIQSIKIGSGLNTSSYGALWSGYISDISVSVTSIAAQKARHPGIAYELAPVRRVGETASSYRRRLQAAQLACGVIG